MYSFVKYGELPKKVRKATYRFNDKADLYEECKNLSDVLRPLGYTFDYGLDGVPSNLTKIKK